VPQVPHVTAGPHPLLTEPQVTLPHAGAVHPVHVPFSHLVAPVHAPHWTVALPQAFSTAPQLAPGPPAFPASSTLHSGGVAPHRPPKHCRPVGHEQAFVLPQPSVMVPQRFTFLFGAQTRGEQPASLGPASLMVSAWHRLLTQSCPASHPPQLIATPHESVLTTPHLPVHVVVGV
jgi:hypothetical protein